MLTPSLSRLAEALQATPDPLVAIEQVGEILDTLPVGIAVVDAGADLTTLYANAALESWAIPARVPVAGHPFDAIFAPADRRRIAAAVAAVAATGNAQSLHGLHLAGGGEAPVDAEGWSGACHPLLDARRRVTRVLVVLAAPTASDRRLTELQRIETERLRAAADRMTALEQVKSDFLRLASHEIRGPLGIVRGYVSMLADGSFGPLAAADIRQPTPILERKLTEMTRLVDQMLETARLEDDRLHITQAPLDLVDVIGEAMLTISGLIDTSRHHLAVDLEQTPIPVIGDRERLSTVLTNLLDNAVKYSPAGGEVRLHCRIGAGVVRVAVSDEGLGIAPEDVPRLFTRFGRIVTPDNSHIAGTGLGLYLCRELIRAHGGGVELASELGRGSTFTVWLPLAGAP